MDNVTIAIVVVAVLLLAFALVRKLYKRSGKPEASDEATIEVRAERCPHCGFVFRESARWSGKLTSGGIQSEFKGTCPRCGRRLRR